MKIYWISAIAGLAILLSFQNCQKSPSADEIIATNAALVSSGNKVNLGEVRVDQVHFSVTANDTIIKAGRTFTTLVNKTIQVDLGSGKVTVISDLGGDPANYCLTEGLKNELITIVKSSSVCKTTNQPADGQVCSAVYRLPYAKIITTNDQYDLGSATDGCGSNAIDLCDGGASLIKGFAANLKSRLGSLACQ